MSDRPFTITEMGDLQTDEDLQHAKESPVIQYKQALQAPLSRDPLARLHRGPFAHMIPSRKYEGDYEGERVNFDDEFLDNGLQDGVEYGSTSTKTHLPGPDQNSSMNNLFSPQMSPEYVEQHKLGYMRDFEEMDGLAVTRDVRNENHAYRLHEHASPNAEPEVQKENQKVSFGAKILNFLHW
ncbi:uncharacterized protein LOC129602873 [Paramacrobiotus metropolitanus]|uniref:uncharacterized protein LOC129602873 n=1 Tax=Paramacrobiotus metropolitanus TaxID=2943436 RepID=UPI0024464475|nr:uncharacterized protein LOC129602873 [Paramacrobiotus metropolitanus]